MRGRAVSTESKLVALILLITGGGVPSTSPITALTLQTSPGTGVALAPNRQSCGFIWTALLKGVVMPVALVALTLPASQAKGVWLWMSVN